MLILALVWLGVPFVLGVFIGAVCASSGRDAGTAAAVVLVLVVGVVLVVYLAGGLSNPPDAGGEPFPQPETSIFIVGVGYVGWLLGVGAGVGASRLLRLTPLDGEGKRQT